MKKTTVNPKLSLLIVIPCLNEQLTIAEMLNRIPKKFYGVDKFEVLVIDDGSTDLTRNIAEMNGATVISHRTNRGLGAAFKTASEFALLSSFDMMVVIDGDLQFDPIQINDVIKPITFGEADVTVGSRFATKSEILHIGSIKKIGNVGITKIINKLAHANYSDVSSGFRCFSREALLRINTNFEYNFSQEILLEIAYHKLDVIEIPVTVVYFADRKSRVASNLWKYGFRIGKIIIRTYRDQYPLRFFWFLAFINFIPSAVFGALFLIHFFETGKFTGFLFAGFLSAYFASIGTAFFLIGILADMLTRVRKNSERTLYYLKKNI